MTSKTGRWPSDRIAFVIATLLGMNSAPAEVPQDFYAQSRALYARIIGFQTSVGLGRVPEMAGFLADRFRAAGFDAQDIHVLPYGETASLVVRYRGDGAGGNPILLNAHMDVVTANRADWRRDPFTLIETGGYFYGRGTWDDKLDVATLTATFLRLKAEGFRPTRDLILAFVGDEETTGATALDLVTNHRDLIDAEYCLSGDIGQGVLDEASGEPRYYQMSGAEKSGVNFELRATNAGGHSSKPRPDNAIYDLADALKALQSHRFPVMWNDWTLGGFKAQGPITGGELGSAMSRFARDPRDAAAAETLSRNPEYNGQLRTTCVATRLSGGHADNALPQLATAVVNCRIFPGQSVQEVRDTLQQWVGAKVSVSERDQRSVSPASPLRPDVVAAVTKAVDAVYPGVPLVPHMEVGASDGATFRANGIPTYGVQGTFVKLSDDHTHGLDERVPVLALRDGLTHWYVLLKELSARSQLSGEHP